MKFPAYVYAILITIMASPVFSQNGQNMKSLAPEIFPPSPDAASLGKYGNTPVGLNTGIPQISIPLYTVKTGTLEFPISISYHAAGIKVTDIASNIGLGWVLNASGVITRSVVGGGSDEHGFWNEHTKSKSEIHNTDDFLYLKTLADGGADGESDYYFYNFADNAGAFVYPQNDRQNPLLIPLQPLKFNYISNHYEVIDELGTIYKFDAKEGSSHDGDNWVNAYYLSQIISANFSDTISFSYETDGLYFVGNTTYYENIGPRCTVDQPTGPPSQSYDQTPGSVTSSRGITPLRLTQIDYANGRIKFIPNTRQDEPDTRIEQMEVYSKGSGGALNLRKTIVFNSGYFDAGSGSTGARYRLKLTGLTEKDQANVVSKVYSFGYNESMVLPVRGSRSQDWWGYYNGQSNSTLLKSESLTFSNHTYLIGSANREPSAAHMQAFMLNKITYPTGGYSEYYYQPHTYATETGSAYGGGLRVSEIRDYDGDNPLPIVKRYVYGTAESGIGVLLVPPEALGSYKQEVIQQLGKHGGRYTCYWYCQANRMTISSRSVYDLTTLNGAAVVYPEVAVYEGSSGAVNGKTIYKFDVYVDEFMGVDKAHNNGRYQINNTWKGGSEISNATYKGTDTNPLHVVTTTPRIYYSKNITGTKVGWKVQMEGCNSYPHPLAGSDNFYWFDYPLRSGMKATAAVKERQYVAGSTTNYTEAQTNYFYDNEAHQQLTRMVTLDERGDRWETRYWYTGDYSSTNTANALKSAHNIATLVKEEQYKNKQIVSGRVTVPNSSGNPVELYTYDTSTPQSPPAHSATTLVPAGYSRKLVVTYDEMKRVKTVRRQNDAINTYYWSYKGKLPVAEVKNDQPAAPMNFPISEASSVTVTTSTTGSPPVMFGPVIEAGIYESTTPAISVQMLGTGGPPSPMINLRLSRIDGSGNVYYHSCTWGVNTVGLLSLTPGKYRWSFECGASAGGTYQGASIYITTAYTGRLNGDKSFHTSFEQNGIADASARTGSKVWSGNYPLKLPGYEGTYNVTYWQKIGTGQWTLIQTTHTVGAGNYRPSIIIGQSGSIIDEVRVFPMGATMTTYTYDPIIGTTSVTDANNSTVRYEYDNAGRLSTSEDQNGNILKLINYHFRGN